MRFVAGLLALALTGGPALAAPACLPQQQAESLVLAIAPALIGTAATVCAPSLPANALLRARVGAFSNKFAVESDRAWPRAKEALKQLTGPDGADMLDSDLARPLVLSLIAPLLAKEIRPSSCGDIDRVLTLMEPLPARNTAALVVTIVELSQRSRATRQANLGFTICPPASARP